MPSLASFNRAGLGTTMIYVPEAVHSAALLLVVLLLLLHGGLLLSAPEWLRRWLQWPRTLMRSAAVLELLVAACFIAPITRLWGITGTIGIALAAALAVSCHGRIVLGLPAFALLGVVLVVFLT